MTSDRRLIEDFIPIGKFLPRLHEKSRFARAYFNAAFVVGTTPLSGGTGSGFRFFGGST